ncbi:NmrA family NAD(P)-binding protein [Paenibacillus sp. 2TAB23]|uniref:NmrA family NAD(P)-binding protein n=1 Tax=Paenibacillus sp. 2TAB23 TaxID=3233004 RepID=UPI003F965BE8
MKIAITGANGRLGRFIIDELIRFMPAEHIVACVRQPANAAGYAEKGVHVRYADYDQPASLDQAFSGVTKLLLISSSNQDDAVRLRQHRNVIDAAKKAGVQYLAYTSFAFIGEAAISLTQLHLATELAVIEAGIPYTFLRNALYTDFVIALGLHEAIATGKLRYPPGEWSFNSAVREDLAVAAAAVLTGDGHANKTYELAAPATWTFHELGTVLQELSGKTISLRPDPEVQHWIYPFLRKIDTASTSDDLVHLLGRPVTPLIESIKPFIQTD